MALSPRALLLLSCLLQLRTPLLPFLPPSPRSHRCTLSQGTQPTHSHSPCPHLEATPSTSPANHTAPPNSHPSLTHGDTDTVLRRNAAREPRLDPGEPNPLPSPLRPPAAAASLDPPATPFATASSPPRPYTHPPIPKGLTYLRDYESAAFGARSSPSCVRWDPRSVLLARTDSLSQPGAVP